MGARYEGDRFRERFGPWAVVAGGSDGIGEAFAREAARRGLHVALVARRQEPLERLAAAIRAEHGVEARAVALDLTSPDLVTSLHARTRELDVGLLVYNAGANRVFRKLVDLEVEDLLFVLDLACRGPLLLAHHFGRRLRARGRGGIVLMSSLAALAGSSWQATYAAAKAFDTILAEGLWHELAPEGVDVLGVLAGATRTPSALGVSDRFEDTMDPAEVASGALDHLGKGPDWIPGAENQAIGRSVWPVARVPLINGMSQAGAELVGRPHQPVEGREFHES